MAHRIAKDHIRVGFLIHDVSRIKKKVFNQKLADKNITRSQWWVLVHLARYEKKEGISQTKLAELMDQGKVSLGGLLDRLEKLELVERRPDPNDRRANRIVITPKGDNLLDDMYNISDELNKQVMAGIAKQDQTKLIEILSRIKENLKSM